MSSFIQGRIASDFKTLVFHLGEKSHYVLIKNISRSCGFLVTLTLLWRPSLGEHSHGLLMKNILKTLRQQEQLHPAFQQGFFSSYH